MSSKRQQAQSNFCISTTPSVMPAALSKTDVLLLTHCQRKGYLMPTISSF